MWPFNREKVPKSGIVLHDFKVKQIDEWAGFHFEWRHILTVYVNGEKRKASFQTDRRFTKEHFQQLVVDALDNGQTYMEIVSRPDFSKSAKFTMTEGVNYL